MYVWEMHRIPESPGGGCPGSVASISRESASPLLHRSRRSSSRKKHRGNQHSKEGESVKVRFAGSASKCAKEPIARQSRWKEAGRQPEQTKRPRTEPSPSTLRLKELRLRIQAATLTILCHRTHQSTRCLHLRVKLRAVCRSMMM